MLIPKLAQFTAVRKVLGETLIANKNRQIARRMATHYRSGALKPKPETMPLGIVGVLCAVLPGLFVGAAISKSVANFLEENELFVVADDDDDDED